MYKTIACRQRNNRELSPLNSFTLPTLAIILSLSTTLGMVEAHGHTAEGSTMAFPHVGFYDIPLPNGSVAKGVKSYEELIEVVRREDAILPEGEVLLLNAFDPIFFPGKERLSKHHLDQVWAYFFFSPIHKNELSVSVFIYLVCSYVV